MNFELITPAASLPLTLAETKQHLRVDFSDDDALIETLIGAAADAVEQMINRVLINSTYAHYFPMFPSTDSELELQAGVSSITSVQYLDADGALQTLDPATYELGKGTVNCLRLANSQSWPTTLTHPEAVTVTVVAGFGADRHSVPDSVKAAMKLLISHWYENRESTVIGTISGELPMAVHLLLSKHKVAYI